MLSSSQGQGNFRGHGQGLENVSSRTPPLLINFLKNFFRFKFLRVSVWSLYNFFFTLLLPLHDGSFHVKTANFQKNSHLTLSDFAETSSKWVFWWIMKICKVLASGHFLFKKYAPPNFAPSCKKFFAFSPNFESSYLWIAVTQIAQTWNFYRHFPTNFRHGFEFLIPCLSFELQTFKTARFFKNILFLPFFWGGISYIANITASSNLQCSLSIYMRLS